MGPMASLYTEILRLIQDFPSGYSFSSPNRQRGHIVSLGFTWIRQAIIVFRPFSEHSGVKGPKNLRTWASGPGRWRFPTVRWNLSRELRAARRGEGRMAPARRANQEP